MSLAVSFIILKTGFRKGRESHRRQSEVQISEQIFSKFLTPKVNH